MLKKNGIRIKTGQRWSIGKATQSLVRDVNNLSYDIGSEVEVLDDMQQGYIKVREIETGVQFDVTVRNLGRMLG